MKRTDKPPGMSVEKWSKSRSNTCLKENIQNSSKRDTKNKGYIHIPDEPNCSEKQTIMTASKIINTKLEARGSNEINFFTLKSPENIREIYNHDKQVINIINSLMTEIDMCKKLNISHEIIVNEKVKERDHWKKLAAQAEILRMKSDRRIRDLEVETMKLKLTVKDLKERKKRMEQRIRQIKNEWKTCRVQLIRDKLKADASREELVYKLKSKNQHHRINKERKKQKQQEGNNLQNRELYRDSLTEKEKSKNELFKALNFMENLYKCLERMRVSDGHSPVDKTFLVNADTMYDSANYKCSVTYLLAQLDAKFISILNEIKSEPFGSNDTFRSKRIGAEKQREISSLKRRLDILQRNYDEIVDKQERNEREKFSQLQQ